MAGTNDERERQTILVVDDVAMFRELEALYLARCGRVLTARDGTEALELLRQQHPDIVVLDLNLPDQDGESICRQIKTDPEHQDIPVIVVTGSGEPADHERALRAGAADVLAKPLSRSGLIDTVNRFVRFATPRGLPRADLCTPLELAWTGGEARGQVRNLSRGGLFAETESLRPNGSELRVGFALPDAELPEAATHVSLGAQVMWHREAWQGEPAGLGLRFLDLDRSLARLLEDYVHEHAETHAPLPPAAAGLQAGR